MPLIISFDSKSQTEIRKSIPMGMRRSCSGLLVSLRLCFISDATFLTRSAAKSDLLCIFVLLADKVRRSLGRDRRHIYE